jgi:hypothetical protein
MENKFKYNSKKNYLKNNFQKNNRGLSAIVTTVILIALSMAALALVWGFINNFINERIDSNQACFGNLDKVKINGQYTCYEAVAGGKFNLRFSLSVGDVDVEKITVLVTSEGNTKNYVITNENQIVTGVTRYPSGEAQIIVPGKNSGMSYLATGFDSEMDSIDIAPTIDGTLCEISDSFAEIYNCASYVG